MILVEEEWQQADAVEKELVGKAKEIATEFTQASKLVEDLWAGHSKGGLPKSSHGVPEFLKGFQKAFEDL